MLMCNLGAFLFVLSLRPGVQTSSLQLWTSIWISGPFQAPLTLGGLPKPAAQYIAGLNKPAAKSEEWTQLCVEKEIQSKAGSN